MRLTTFALMLAFTAACATLPLRGTDPIRVLVLNMHAGKDAKGARNLDAVAALVTQTKADLVLLQEVDRRTKRAGGEDQVDVLAGATHYAPAFGPSLVAYDGGQYGIAVLSRGFVGFKTTHSLPVSPAQTRAGGSHEPRVALLAFADVRGNPWTVINTHLDPAEGPARGQEIGHLVDLVKQEQLTATPLVVGGDFNSTPDNPVLQTLKAAGLRDAWTECGSGDGFTYPADTPTKRIDYLWLSGNLHCASAQVLDTQISDHRPVVVTMK